MTTMQTTKVNRGWFIKRLLLPAIALMVLGVWGLVDATTIYPASGRLDASLKLKNYLHAAEESRRLTSSFVQVEDPGAELAKLAAREDAKGTGAGGVLTPMERSRLEWLRALKVVWAIDDAEVWVADITRPIVSKTGENVYAGVGGVSDVKQERLPLFYKARTAEGFVRAKDGAAQPVPLDGVTRYLKDYWATAKTPSPLAAYDLPLQWLFTFVGFGGVVYLAVLYLRVASKKFHFEPETHTLVLPGGERVSPADLKEVDKRKWHKFYVTLNLNDGRAHTLDLYRHDPLEEWVLAIEKAAFPETKADEGTRAGEDGVDGGEEGEDVLAAPKDVGRVHAMTYGGIKDGVFGVFVFQSEAIRAAGGSPAAYAQGEVLKALAVALRDEGGWRQWLTAACGAVKGREAATVVNWLAEREATFKAAFSNHEPIVAAAVARAAEGAGGAGGAGGAALEGEWYVVVVGRLSEEVARRASDILLDPPPSGFGAFAAIRVNPPTIDRFQESVGFEPGMEIKGEALVGRWEVSPDDADTAGLKSEVAPEARRE